MKKFKLALLAAMLAAGSASWAQTEGKAALVKQLLEVQRPAIEGIARGLVEQSMAPIAQGGGEYLQTNVAADKREAIGKAADAELSRYRNEAFPIVRDKAVQLAPSTIGPLLEQNFSEDELRQLIAWLGSPLNKKYSELNPQLGNALTTKLVADVRPTIEPKLQTLEASVAKVLGVPPPSGNGGTAGTAPRSKTPAKK
ncbi:MAG: hypothetical protein JWQ03_2626 [Variovorax sp.]|nr:hypothetical protein [Variovorax sp.]